MITLLQQFPRLIHLLYSTYPYTSLGVYGTCPKIARNPNAGPGKRIWGQVPYTPSTATYPIPDYPSAPTSTPSPNAYWNFLLSF